MTTGVALAAEPMRRLQRFKESDQFRTASADIAKSSYWKAHSAYLVSDVTSDAQVSIGGQSGYYVPPAASAVTRLRSRAAAAAAEPARAVTALRTRLAQRFGTPRFMSYDDAFDAVMTHHRVADVELSPWRVDHRALSGRPDVFSSAAAVRRHYQGWSGYRATAHIIGHYYYQNLLRGYLPAGGLGTVLEIGAGNGNFPAILFHDWSPSRFVLVDLPETVAVAFVFLMKTFPAAAVVLPNECGDAGTPLPKDADFVFLTTEQIDRIESDSVDLAVNCHSFQEMTRAQIELYFDLIQRACRPGAHFLAANRVEKIPGAPDSHHRPQPDPPNRFAEFPWHPKNHVRVHEVSRLLRLVQPDNVAIRLERIGK